MLTPKQKVFCEVYIQTTNATEAARQAGYKGNAQTLGAIGSENLKKPQIKEYISSRITPKEDKLIADSDEVMRFYSAVMRGEIKDQFGLEASLSDRLKAGDALAKRFAIVEKMDNDKKANETGKSVTVRFMGDAQDWSK